MAKPTSSPDPFSMTNNEIMKEVFDTHIPGDENYDVEALLNVAENAIKHSTQIADTYLLEDTTESIGFAEDKPIPKGLTLPLSQIKQIGYQMICQLAHPQDHAHQTTMAIFNELRNFNWDAKAAITLAAFAMEYGNFWHRAEAQATVAPLLGKSLALLSGGFDINRLQDLDIQKPAFDTFHNLIELALQITESIIELKKLSEVGVDQGEVPELLKAIQDIPVDVYWVIITIVVCTTQISVLLGHNRYSLLSTSMREYKPDLSQFAKKLNSVLTNLTELVTKIRKKTDAILRQRANFAAASQQTYSISTRTYSISTFSDKTYSLQPEIKATYPNIIFGEKKNNFSYERVAVDPTGFVPARPTDIVYPLGKSSFPEDFIFGTATAAYQIEGAAEKRGRSAWDDFTHCHSVKIKDRSNGDVACDSYNRYEEDIQLMKEMNTRAYRFSISWSRILRNGKLGSEIREGIEFYKKLLCSLTSKGIIPFVTLFHVDRPQDLEKKYGGFLSEEMIKDFKDFAELCFKEFGQYVKHWITFNEPHIYCYTGYVEGIFAPAHSSNPGTEPYKVAHNILRAHAEAVEVYNTKYKASQNGQIGMTLDSIWTVPFSNDIADREAAFRAMDFWLGWFLEPLTTGAYPETMRSRVKERLPTFSDEESDKLRGSFDFIGINYYTSKFAADYTSKKPSLSYVTDSGVDLKYWCRGSSIGERTASGMYSYPKGLRDLLCYIQERYENPSIYITENGIATFNEQGLHLQGALLDVPRVRYHNEHLYYVLAAIKNDGVDVKGYFAWSLLDNFEWNQGYTMQFGMYFVDFKNDRKRYRKLSAQWFKIFLEN